MGHNDYETWTGLTYPAKLEGRGFSMAPAADTARGFYVACIDRDTLRIFRHDWIWLWEEVFTLPVANTVSDQTSIAVAGDTVVCFFEYLSSMSLACTWRYDLGTSSWGVGMVHTPSISVANPAGACYGGGGTAVVYTDRSMISFWGSYKYQSCKTIGEFGMNLPTTFSDAGHGPSFISEPDIECLLPGVFGLIWVGGGDTGARAYFDILSCCNIRGDANGDGAPLIDIADLVYLVDYMFTGGPEPSCWAEGDIDGSAVEPIDIADLVYLAYHLFHGGNPPCCPF